MKAVLRVMRKEVTSEFEVDLPGVDANAGAARIMAAAVKLMASKNAGSSRDQAEVLLSVRPLPGTYY